MLDFWATFINEPTGGFLVVLVGTLLLFAEVLVKGKLIFGAVGLASISLYFIAHMQENQMMLMTILYVLGMLLVMLDGKFIGDGTLGVIGLIVMLVGLALPSPDLLYGITVSAAFIIGGLGSLTFLKFMPRRDLWSQLALKETLSSEAGYNSMNEKYKQLQGKKGVAETRFNPTGTIKVEGELYSATSEGRWIEKGDTLQVTNVSGTRILVRKVEEEEPQD